jgi:MFS family permease
VILFGASALTVALIVDNVCNGGARPLFGWISDQIGREYTMAIAFGLGGIAYWLLGALGHAPWAFVVFAALIFLTWGEIFSLFPSTCTDTFGTKFATVNLSLLYTAKGASAFLVSVANLIKSASGGWHLVFRIDRDYEFRSGGIGSVRAQAVAGAVPGQRLRPRARSALMRFRVSVRSSADGPRRQRCQLLEGAERFALA